MEIELNSFGLSDEDVIDRTPYSILELENSSSQTQFTYFSSKEEDRFKNRLENSYVLIVYDYKISKRFNVSLAKYVECKIIKSMYSTKDLNSCLEIVRWFVKQTTDTIDKLSDEQLKEIIGQEIK